MLVADALLGLQLGCHKLVIDIFDVADTGKGHLPVHIVVEPLATHEITHHNRNLCS